MHALRIVSHLQGDTPVVGMVAAWVIYFYNMACQVAGCKMVSISPLYKYLSLDRLYLIHFLCVWPTQL